jgi:SAM-dependent methyltransferase
MSSDHYTTGFYEEIKKGATSSAAVMLPQVLELIPVRSVVDVGCGEGHWLSIFEKLGVEDVLGIDGDYIDQARLAIPQSQFQVFDLTKPFILGRMFDLAISLEVAEHLPADCAPNFVKCLTRLSPVILFSAAIPFQGGNHHVNEQWPDEWAALFREHNYHPIDFIRKRVWQNSAVEWWYAQNTLLYARADALESNATLRAEFESTNLSQLALVHPKQYLHLHSLYSKAISPVGVIEASKILTSSLRRSVTWRFRSVFSKRVRLQTVWPKRNVQG